MARITSFFTACVVLAASTAAVPLLSKRIAQTTIDAPQKWRDACTSSNGGEQCTDIAVNAAATLLAAAGPCEQQNSADAMIDLGKQLNSQDMITAAQIFAQQPRNSPNSVSTPYCQQAPANTELTGLFQCQFQGSDAKNFAGGLTAGDKGTIPFGQTAVLNPAGSCPAKPDGPIADGSQLSDITSSPGTASSSSSNSTSGGAGTSSASVTASAGTPSATASTGESSSGSSSSSGAEAGSGSGSGSSTSTAPAATTSSIGSSSSASGFQAQNAKDAQALNAKFATLTADSSCNDGDQACVNGGFAQCVGGKFQVTQCSGGTQCLALPLVNKPGTSITCDTSADAAARMTAAGVSGGVDGNGGAGSSSSGKSTSGSSSTSGASSSGTKSTQSSEMVSNAASVSSGDFKAQNAKDAQALNAKFATLTTSSACNDGDEACVDGGFAQCFGGTFQVAQCSAGTQCFALPLVNKAGTSISCDSAADAAARIAATGVSGGIDGLS